MKEEDQDLKSSTWTGAFGGKGGTYIVTADHPPHVFFSSFLASPTTSEVLNEVLTVASIFFLHVINRHGTPPPKKKQRHFER